MSPPHSSPFRRKFTIVVILGAIALGGYFGWRHFRGSDTEMAASDKSDQKPPAIPVTVAQAQTTDFPVSLNGLGTVEPYNTVVVRSRVDGEIIIGDDNKAEMRAITVGQEGNGQAVILQGLSAGQRVAIAGQYRQQQGALVQPKEVSAPSPPETAAQNTSVKVP